jgi:branched-chain amino acid transport system ATP-binding protein
MSAPPQSRVEPAAEVVLELRDVDAFYGHVHALRSVSLRVRRGEVVTLIGANGAGKSTTLRVISGLLRPKRGEVRVCGRAINGLPPHKVATLGIGHVPEGRRIFAKLTVEENLDMGAFLERDRNVVKARKDKAFQMFPRLAERRSQEGGTLSGGEQQMLAIARALMQDPPLLLLDEPTMGLAPVLMDLIFDTVQALNREGKTILLVEENAWHALRIAHRGYVLQTGIVVLDGSGEALAANPEVQQSYLGGD